MLSHPLLDDTNTSVRNDVSLLASNLHPSLSIQEEHVDTNAVNNIVNDNIHDKQQSTTTKFESADYDTPDSNVFEEANQALPYYTSAFHVFLLALTGVSIGLAASLLTYISRVLQSSKTNLMNFYIIQEKNGIVPTGTAFLVYLSISLLYGILASFPVAYIEPTAGGSGIPEIKCVLNGVQMPGVLNIRTFFCKIFGLIFAVSAGLPVGKEGPMIHSGSILAAYIASGRLPSIFGEKKLSLHSQLQHDHERRDMVVCGSAAGVAAAFGAPIGGVLFAVEEGASFWYKKLTWQSFFCAIVAAYTIDVFLSGLGVPGQQAGSWGTLGTPGMFSFGSFSTEATKWEYWESIIFIFIGILGGLIGAAFVAVNRVITLWRFKNIPVSNPTKRFIEVLIIIILNCIVKFFLSTLSKCHKNPSSSSDDDDSLGSLNYFAGTSFYCEEGTYADIGSLFLVNSEDSIRQLFHFSATNAFPLASLAIFFIGYTITAVIAYGIAIPSGLFIPSLLSGAALGRLVGNIIYASLVSFGRQDLANKLHISLYSLTGAAAVLGGNTRMVISLAVIIVECIGNYSFSLPLTIVLFVARLVGNTFNEGIYDLHIDLRKIPVLNDSLPGKFQYDLRVCDVMSKKVITFTEIEKVGVILDSLLSCSHSAFPVVYSIDTLNSYPRLGSFAGLIGRKELSILLEKRAFHDDLPTLPLIKGEETNTSSESATTITSAAVSLHLNDRLITRIPSSLLLSPHYLLSISQNSKSVIKSSRSNTQSSPLRNDSLKSTETKFLNSKSDSEIVAEPVYESEPLLTWKDFDHKSPNIQTLSSTIKTSQTEDQSKYIDLRPYMNPTPYTINALAPLNRAFKLFRHQGLRHLIVINDAHDVVGVISRSDLITLNLEKILSQTTRRKRWDTSFWYNTTTLDD
jgi:chloride channel 7